MEKEEESNNTWKTQKVEERKRRKARIETRSRRIEAKERKKGRGERRIKNGRR